MNQSTLKSNFLKLTCGLALLGAAFTVKAQSVISFAGGQINYPSLGFTTTTVGGAAPFNYVAGLSNGDPGNWGIEGYPGPDVLGISGDLGGRGQAYTGPGDTEYAAIDFTVPNTTTPLAVNVSFDVFDRAGDSGTYTFYGFNNGSLVSTVTPTLSAVTIDGYAERMATVYLTGVEEIRFNATDFGGIDNVVFPSVIPEPSTLVMSLMGGLALLFCRRKS
jgi:hypothetical protein